MTAVFLTVSLVGLLSTFWYFVRTVGGQSFDSRALRGQDLQLPALIRASGETVRLGLEFGGAFVGIFVLVALASGRWRAALAAMIVAGGSFLTTQALKVALNRPSLVVVTLDDRHGNSFPSGHSTVAFSFVVALIIVAPGRIRGLAALIGAPYATTIAAATVFARWHRPSDVIGAAFVVIFWTFGVTFWFGRARDASAPSKFAFLTLAMLTLVAAAFMVAFTSMTSKGLNRRLLIVDSQQGRLAADAAGAFKVATSSIAAASCLLSAAVVVVLSRMAPEKAPNRSQEPP
jgi:membrane-associated phospholipid phosphatase